MTTVPDVERATTTAIPTRQQRVAARRAMLAFTARRQRAGSGSMLHALLKARRPAMDRWLASVRVLEDQGIHVAVTGAVAANAYMPPR